MWTALKGVLFRALFRDRNLCDSKIFYFLPFGSGFNFLFSQLFCHIQNMDKWLVWLQYCEELSVFLQRKPGPMGANCSRRRHLYMGFHWGGRTERDIRQWTSESGQLNLWHLSHNTTYTLPETLDFLWTVPHPAETGGSAEGRRGRIHSEK